MPAEQKSELAFLPLQADRSERPGVPGLTIVVAVVRVAEVARKREEPSLKSLDLDENLKC